MRNNHAHQIAPRRHQGTTRRLNSSGTGASPERSRVSGPGLERMAEAPMPRWIGLFVASCLCGSIFIASGCGSNPSVKNDLKAGYQSLETSNYDAAISQADASLRKNPAGRTAAEALYLKGRALEVKPYTSQAEADANFAAAREAYQQALTHNPRKDLDGLIRAGLGNTNYWLEDFNSAARHWAGAYEILSDRNAKSFVLYRIGLCYQRMGDFVGADQRFAMVQQTFPGTDAAARAREKQGYKEFNVQIGVFANAQNAAATIAQLQQEGLVVRKGSNKQGQTVVSLGPFRNYEQASAARDRAAARHPQAIVVP